MSRSKPPAMALLGSSEHVGAQFYKPLRAAAIDRLMALWSDDDDDDEVVCVLAGGVRVCWPAVAGGGMPVSLAHSRVHSQYRAPWWLPGGQAQTIWPALVGRRPSTPPVVFRRERWTAPDGDFIDVDFQDAAAGAPLLVLFHGLEGSSRSHYAQAFAQWARRHGVAYAVPHFRGCSGELNLAPRAYHSGDHEELAWILTRLRQRCAAPVWAVGVSMGGNALLRWAQEAGETASQTVRAVAALCSPVDLGAGGHAIGQGVNRLIYTRMFLASMRPKAFAKLAQHPGLFDGEQMRAVRTLREFDQLFTAPLHGFAGVDDYWTRASAKPHLKRLRVPALLLNSRNDPFVPAASLPQPAQVGAFVTLWQPAHGGHVGFPAGRFPGHGQALPEAVMAWMVKTH